MEAEEDCIMTSFITRILFQVLVRWIKSRKIIWAEHVARMGEIRNACRILVGKPEGERPLGIPRSTWEDNITMDHGEIDWEDVNWIHLTQERDH
jgi:hypothetical protein